MQSPYTNSKHLHIINSMSLPNRFSNYKRIDKINRNIRPCSLNKLYRFIKIICITCLHVENSNICFNLNNIENRQDIIKLL